MLMDLVSQTAPTLQTLDTFLPCPFPTEGCYLTIKTADVGRYLNSTHSHNAECTPPKTAIHQSLTSAAAAPGRGNEKAPAWFMYCTFPSLSQQEFGEPCRETLCIITSYHFIPTLSHRGLSIYLELLETEPLMQTLVAVIFDWAYLKLPANIWLQMKPFK